MTTQCLYDLATAQLISQHLGEVMVRARDEVKVSVVGSLSADNTKRTVKGKREPKPTSNPNQSGVALGFILPEKGSLNAEDFIKAMRKATDRNAMIQAISGYCGYDPRESFGGQDIVARSKAMREINAARSNKHAKIGGLSREEQRAAARSLHETNNAVQGKPDTIARNLANLEAQRVFYVEAMLACQAKGDEVGALIERARLNDLNGQIEAACK